MAGEFAQRQIFLAPLFVQTVVRHYLMQESFVAKPSPKKSLQQYLISLKIIKDRAPEKIVSVRRLVEMKTRTGLAILALSHKWELYAPNVWVYACLNGTSHMGTMCCPVYVIHAVPTHYPPLEACSPIYMAPFVKRAICGFQRSLQSIWRIMNGRLLGEWAQQLGATYISPSYGRYSFRTNCTIMWIHSKANERCWLECCPTNRILPIVHHNLDRSPAITITCNIICKKAMRAKN